MFKTACAFLIGMATAPAFAANVGVSINVGDPGYYGQINIGNIPQPPQIIYSQPVYVQRAPAGIDARPIYLRVPPGHEKHWNKHCRAYNACNRPVYFVREDWYQRQYVRGNRDDDRRRDRDRDDDRRGGDRGRGHGDDHGHGNGHH